MERYMVILTMAGRTVAHFFQHKNVAEIYVKDWSQIHSCKLYEYDPDTDSWKSI